MGSGIVQVLGMVYIASICNTTCSDICSLGLMFVVGLFKSNFTGEGLADKYKKTKHQPMVMSILNPWITLLFGWLAYLIWLT